MGCLYQPLLKLERGESLVWVLQGTAASACDEHGESTWSKLCQVCSKLFRKTMGVDSLETSPTIGQMDVSE